jgi:hypothetical protein
MSEMAKALKTWSYREGYSIILFLWLKHVSHIEISLQFDRGVW